MKIWSLLELLVGILTTIGGWLLLLITLDVLPFPDFSILSTVVLMFGFCAMLCGMLGYGPLIIRDALKKVEEERAVPRVYEPTLFNYEELFDIEPFLESVEMVAG